MTRNGATKEVKIYTQGVFKAGFTDTGNLATISTARNVVRFFIDDATTSDGENAAGAVDHSRIFKVVLSVKDASDLAKGLLPPNVRQM
jgi:hypothetical protein